MVDMTVFCVPGCNGNVVLPKVIDAHLSVFWAEHRDYFRHPVVDDNPDIVYTLQVELESDPTIQVYSFDNPVTALVEFRPNFYDLLLIDVNMPLMDGFQLAQNLVQDLNVNKLAKIIMIYISS